MIIALSRYITQLLRWFLLGGVSREVIHTALVSVSSSHWKFLSANQSVLEAISRASTLRSSHNPTCKLSLGLSHHLVVWRGGFLRSFYGTESLRSIVYHSSSHTIDSPVCSLKLFVMKFVYAELTLTMLMLALFINNYLRARSSGFLLTKFIV